MVAVIARLRGNRHCAAEDEEETVDRVVRGRDWVEEGGVVRKNRVGWGWQE